jgi:hypothetical protein
MSRSRHRPCPSRAPRHRLGRSHVAGRGDLRPAAEVLEDERLRATLCPNARDVEEEGPCRAAGGSTSRYSPKKATSSRLGAADVAPLAAGAHVHLDDRRGPAVRSPPEGDLRGVGECLPDELARRVEDALVRKPSTAWRGPLRGAPMMGAPVMTERVVSRGSPSRVPRIWSPRRPDRTRRPHLCDVPGATGA